MQFSQHGNFPWRNRFRPITTLRAFCTTRPCTTHLLLVRHLSEVILAAPDVDVGVDAMLHQPEVEQFKGLHLVVHVELLEPRSRVGALVELDGLVLLRVAARVRQPQLPVDLAVPLHPRVIVRVPDDDPPGNKQTPTVPPSRLHARTDQQTAQGTTKKTGKPANRRVWADRWKHRRH